MPYNPFTPNFGQIPPHIAGRDSVISEVLSALEQGTGHPAQTSVFVGARGSGKTALLSYFAEEAASRGWLSVNTTCIPGIREDLIQQIQITAQEFLPKTKGSRLTSVAVGNVLSASWEREEERTPNWRTQISKVIDFLAEHDTGLLITVDEVTPRLDEMVEIAAVYQLLLREKKKVALFMAGLPSEISALLNDRSVSFLRRASQYTLGRIEDYEIERAFLKTIGDAGKTIEQAALREAVATIDGFPYMMQLVGFRAFEATGEKKRITTAAVRDGVRLARLDFESRVLEATVQELSDGDRAFLFAMLTDREISAVSDIEKRLKKNSGYVSRYRARLLEAGVIESAGRGRVKFALPAMREYLEERLP